MAFAARCKLAFAMKNTTDLASGASRDRSDVTKNVIAELAPTGILRAGINTQNFLLVSDRDESGNPTGIAPSMARAIAARLGVPLHLVAYESAKRLGDAIEDGAWDICFLGAEPARAERLGFTPAYCEIEATYLVPSGSPLNAIGDVDRSGIRIATNTGSAYDLWLTRNIKHAQLIHSPDLPKSRDLFVEQRLDVLAGLRTWLLQQAERLPGSRLLDGKFTAVQQAIGTRGDNAAGVEFLTAFVEEAKRSGLIADLITQHRVQGLSVAA
jgi:polar amino acid transport system substrate-binding protein